MAKRRGAGEGSLFRRGDGRWVGLLQVGVDERGRRKRRAVSGRSRAQAQQKLDRLRARAQRGLLDEAGSLRLGRYLEAWLAGPAANRVRPTTLRYYERVLAPVRAQLGGVRLRLLTPLHVERLLREREEQGVSPRGRQMLYTVLRTALRDAVRRRLLAVHPLDAVDRPRVPKPEVRHLDREQVRRLLEVARADRLEALYVLAVTTGARQGELLGLRWRDVDLDGRAMHVRRTLIEDPTTGRPVFAEPKTKRARRKVDLPARAVGALRRHRRRGGGVPHAETPVFTSREGCPIRRANLHRRSFKPLLRRAGLPDVPFHALRHTAATLALAAGVPAKVVQERLGHASVTLTLDTYSAVLPTLGREAAERIDAVLGSRWRSGGRPARRRARAGGARRPPPPTPELPEPEADAG